MIFRTYVTCMAKSAIRGVQRTTVAVTNRAGDTVAQYPASIVGTDASHDLAVLRIEAPAEDLQPVRHAHRVFTK